MITLNLNEILREYIDSDGDPEVADAANIELDILLADRTAYTVQKNIAAELRAELAAKDAAIEAAREALRDVQWNGMRYVSSSDTRTLPCCPSCGGRIYSGQIDHADDCQIAAALAKLEGAK